MENTTIKINCWEFKDGNEVPMLSTATLDGFEWNAKYRLTVSNDDGSLGLPFLFAADDTAILTVETSEQDGMGTGDKKIKQVISCVPRSLGNEITCSRIRSYNGKEHVWSAWETMSSAGGIKVDWDASSCVDTFIAAGIYNIRGERLNVKDGLPIANSNPGHTINARLVVIDSSISGTGDTDDKCITQILTLSNRTGGDGDVYIRTGRAQSTNVLAGGSGWEPWGKLQQNIEVGQVTSLNSFIGNGIYSGVYTNGSSFFETFVMVVINNYAVAGATGRVRSVSQFKYALNVDSAFSYKTRIGRGGSSIEWGSWVDLGAATTTDIQDNSITAQKLSSDVREKVEKVLPLEENATKEKNALLNGDTIVGLAREVYSRQGKTDTATFLKRTTAGGTSICDGVASIKQIGGNIVKNLVDGKFNNVTYDARYISVDIADGILKATGLQHSVYHSLSYKDTTKAEHLYYSSVLFYNYNAATVLVSNSSGYNQTESYIRGEWAYLSVLSPIYQNFTSVVLRIYPEGDTLPVVLFKNWLCIDLTEMYGAGNEPTKEECDRMFGTIDAIPQGLTIAQPTGLKSTGYNQWNPENVLEYKSVSAGSIIGVSGSHIAVIECLPCKTGTGENNGYVIGYGEGDAWSNEGIEVYFTPLNPLEVDGELYLQKLDKDATYGTYVPQIKGYLLVVTPTTDKLCAHFHWSGDRAATDCEPYVESNVALPVIPEMSEWGLAGIQTNGTKVQDLINLENNIYTKRIGCIDLGTLTWTKHTLLWHCYSYDGKNVYILSQWTNPTYAFIETTFTREKKINVSYVASNDSLIISENKGDYMSGEIYNRNAEGDITIDTWRANSDLHAYPTNDFNIGNIICGRYRAMTRGEGAYGSTANGVASCMKLFSIVDNTFSGKSASEVKSVLSGVLLYYEMVTPEEYPIVTKAAPNYIGSDYGVEEFAGSKVPLVANILFYMRSLVSETRNFLDRLMAGLGTSDATAVADRIVAAVTASEQPTVVSDEQMAE